MLAGRSIALPDSGPVRGRDPARRSAALITDEPDGEPDPDVTRDEEPEEDPLEPVLDPLRGVADPDLLLDDEEGVREPAGV